MRKPFGNLSNKITVRYVKTICLRLLKKKHRFISLVLHLMCDLSEQFGGAEFLAVKIYKDFCTPTRLFARIPDKIRVQVNNHNKISCSRSTNNTPNVHFKLQSQRVRGQGFKPLYKLYQPWKKIGRYVSYFVFFFLLLFFFQYPIPFPHKKILSMHTTEIDDSSNRSAGTIMVGRERAVC